MNNDRKQIFEKALNYDSDVPLRFYLQLKPKWNYYREQYVQLYLEARRCFFNDCPKAATIIAGESLLRAIFDRIVYLYDTRANINTQNLLYGSRNNKTSLYNLFQSNNYSHYDLLSTLSFDNAINILEQSNLYSQQLINRMYDIKALRNMVTHQGHVVIDQWDINVCKSRDDFRTMMRSVSWEFPEAYRLLNKGRSKSSWIHFNCKEYNCTMKEIITEYRVAAIQLQFVQEVVKNFSTGNFDRERYENEI